MIKIQRLTQGGMMKIYFYCIIAFLVNCYANPLFADNDSKTINSSLYQNRIRTNVFDSNVSQLKSSIEDNKNNLARLFALLECKHRNIPVDKHDSKMVDIMILLKQGGYKRIFLTKNTAFPVIMLLKEFTYNNNKNYKEILLWLDKEKTKQNPSRHDWAVSRIDAILQRDESLSRKDKQTIAGMTLNFRVKIQDKNSFLKWWSKNKSKSRRNWIIDSLDWAIQNIDNKDKEKSVTALQLINTILTTNKLVNLGILKDKEDILLELNNNDKKLLEKWLKENKDTFNPFYKHDETAIQLWKF